MKIFANLEVFFKVIAKEFRRDDDTPVIFDDDVRLSDNRTPTTHASSHSTGSPDQIIPSSIGAASENHTHIEFHNHTNKTVLDKFSQSGNTLLFDGNVVEGTGSPISTRWIDYATGFLTLPVLIADTEAHQIWRYEYTDLTLFREITSTTDIFFADYTEGILSNIIAKKQL